MTKDLLELSKDWMRLATKYKYAYNFSWLGVQIMQIPQDIYAYQELIWKVKPDLIIETGIAHGGSLILSASMLALLDYCEAIEKGETLKILNPLYYGRKAVGIDNEIRLHNKKAVEEHPLSHIIQMIEGSSIDPNIIKQVYNISRNYKNKSIIVFLDADHTHNHVLAELKAYAPMVSIGSYCVIWDTGIEDIPDHIYNNRPWGKGNNPYTAVHEYLKTTDKFEIDTTLQNNLIMTSSKDGFLKRIK